MAKRDLTTLEVREATLVFAGNLDFSRIQIHEGAAMPDRIAAIGAKLHGTTPPTHNAITLGNHIFFPVEIRVSTSDELQANLSQMAWLVHELTHCWQFQHGGIGPFFKALWAQIRLGSDAYAYGWQAGLEQALSEGGTIDDFNPEQQGEIARHYYFRLKQGLDTRAWVPWIEAIQAAEISP